MSYLSGLEASLDELVHEGARASEVERARHAQFIRLRLLMPLATAMLAPVLLALGGAPPLWEAASFTLAMCPLLAVVLVARRGAIAEGHMICVAAFAGLALMAASGAGIGIAACGWLMLMPFEAALTGSTQRTIVATLAAFFVCASIFAAALAGFLPPAGSEPLAEAIMGAGALVYAIGLALSWRKDIDLRGRLIRRETAERMTITGLLGDVLLRFNRDGAVLSASANCVAVLGLQARDLSGRGFCERVQVADRPVFLKAIADAASCRTNPVVQLRLHSSDVESERGSFSEPAFRHVEMRACAVTGADDGAAVLALLRDVEDVVEARRIIDNKTMISQDELLWKKRLLASVSHELRTPLNAIIGFSEVLGSRQLSAQDDAQRREYADIINASGQHLLSLVDSILDMSTIEAGSFQICTEEVDLLPLIETCCDIVRLKARDAGIEISRDCRVEANKLVADKRACRQILLNLLSNAIKFTPTGGSVTVGTRAEDNHLAIFVADNGVGIRGADLPRLGDPFFQGQSAQARRSEGTGLGLSVVRSLVGLHGGTIYLESAPGQGTCVTVRLPREEAVRTAEGSHARIEAFPRRPSASLNDVKMVKKIA